MSKVTSYLTSLTFRANHQLYSPDRTHDGVESADQMSYDCFLGECAERSKKRFFVEAGVNILQSGRYGLSSQFMEE